jgi:hypothetical protein
MNDFDCPHLWRDGLCKRITYETINKRGKRQVERDFCAVLDGKECPFGFGRKGVK